MHITSFRFLALAFTGIISFSVRANADSGQAEELFVLGKQQMDQKDYTKACKSFEESNKLDPQVGTQYNLAICQEAAGKIASAWSGYLSVQDLSLKQAPPNVERSRAAGERAEKLRSRIARIKVLVLPSVREPGMEVRIDGKPVPEPLWDRGNPADIGTHNVIAVAPGKLPFNGKVRVEEDGVSVQVEVTKLDPAPPGVDTMAVKKEESQVADTGRLLAEREVTSRSKSIAGYVVGGVGLVTAVTGGIFGILTFLQKPEANACPREQFCADRPLDLARANDAYSRGQLFGSLSSVLLPVGLVTLGVGIVMVLTSSSKENVKTTSNNTWFLPKRTETDDGVGRWH
jgi:hypothetical protein